MPLPSPSSLLHVDMSLKGKKELLDFILPNRNIVTCWSLLSYKMGSSFWECHSFYCIKTTYAIVCCDVMVSSWRLSVSEYSSGTNFVVFILWNVLLGHITICTGSIQKHLGQDPSGLLAHGNCKSDVQTQLLHSARLTCGKPLLRLSRSSVQSERKREPKGDVGVCVETLLCTWKMFSGLLHCFCSIAPSKTAKLLLEVPSPVEGAIAWVPLPWPGAPCVTLATPHVYIEQHCSSPVIKNNGKKECRTDDLHIRQHKGVLDFWKPPLQIAGTESPFAAEIFILLMLNNKATFFK